jgi:hypothetical protein
MTHPHPCDKIRNKTITTKRIIIYFLYQLQNEIFWFSFFMARNINRDIVARETYRYVESISIVEPSPFQKKNKCSSSQLFDNILSDELTY